MYYMYILCGQGHPNQVDVQYLVCVNTKKKCSYFTEKIESRQGLKKNMFS